jgi:type I restriction enzyme S subunit
MSSGEVNKGRIFETDTMITQLGYDNASTKLVPSKTVVLAMAGQGKTRGTAAITEIELCTNQSLCSIVNNEKVNAEYLLHFLRLQYMELRGASTNTEGRGGLNLKIIGNFPIMIPPIVLQNQFAVFVEQIDKSKFEIQKSLEKLETLKKALMQKYFG